MLFQFWSVNYFSQHASETDVPHSVVLEEYITNALIND